MDIHVLRQVEFLTEPLPAKFAGILFVRGMVPKHVAPEGWSARKALVAKLTDVPFDA